MVAAGGPQGPRGLREARKMSLYPYDDEQEINVQKSLGARSPGNGDDRICERLWTRAIEPLYSPFDQKSPKLGVELEVFPLHSESFLPLGLDPDIPELRSDLLLEKAFQLCPEGEAQLLRDGDVIYGLKLSNGQSYTLEPGGQIELATLPRMAIHEIASDLVEAFTLLEQAADGRVKFLSHGTHPLSNDQLPLLVPKTRYRVLSRYLESEPGGRGVHMMRHTATVQPNLDVGPLAADWRDAVRLAYRLSPYLKKLFPHSFFFQNKFADDGLERQRIWQAMDSSRTGVPAGIEESENPACRYVSWAEQAGVFWIEGLPESEQPQFGQLTFAAWLESGYLGRQPSLADWEAHLNTLFPEIRLRNFLELRMLDAQPFETIVPLMAFFKGALQSRRGRKALTEVLDGFVARHPDMSVVNLPSQPILDLWPAFVEAAKEGLRELEDPCAMKYLESLDPIRVESFRQYTDAHQYVKLRSTRWPSASFRACEDFCHVEDVLNENVPPL